MAVLAEGLALQASPLRHPPRCLQTLELGAEASARSPPPPALLRGPVGREADGGKPRPTPESTEQMRAVARPESSVLFRVSGKKSDSKEARKPEEAKLRKKPGPKPGWKAKLRCERWGGPGRGGGGAGGAGGGSTAQRALRCREELPTIYKCPYQGCTAVYRGADGMKVSRAGAGLWASPVSSGGGRCRGSAAGTQGPVSPQKHIKEHHEEVRERPCPHPGCNKVFMIDRYLQRHVKLIHTGVS